VRSILTFFYSANKPPLQGLQVLAEAYRRIVDKVMGEEMSAGLQKMS